MPHERCWPSSTRDAGWVVPGSSPTRGRVGAGVESDSVGRGEVERHAEAAERGLGEFHAAAVRLRHASREREPETRSGARGRAAFEPSQHPVAVRRRDAGTVVVDRDRRRRSNRDGDPREVVAATAVHCDVA